MPPNSAPPPPALVVISGGAASATASPAAAVPVARLLKALGAAQRVLQVGDDGGALAREHQSRQPACDWITLDPAALDTAAPGAAAGAGQTLFDAIVLARPLAGFDDPLALLRSLARWADERTQLVLDVANHATLALLCRTAEGDLTDAAEGQVLASPASVYKLLMDAGWMPTLADATAAPVRNEAAAAAALALAEALNVPRATAQRTLTMDRLTVRAERRFDAAPAAPGPARFTVVVPTTRETQLRLNVERSPGLQEVDARIVSYRHAATPADALQGSLPHVAEDWVLLCHQDVYFPAGFGERLNAVLAEVPAEERPRTLIGFAGMGVNRQTHAYQKAGFVIDRLHRFDHPASDAAVSIDELALVVSRDTVLRIDPALGWHLWATDLCLSAICEHQVFPRIVRLPLFHNSLNDFKLPGSFYESAAALMAKYPQFGPIHTLCGTLDAQFLAQARSAGG